MTHAISIAGLIHTLASLLPVIIALYSLIKYQRIMPGRTSGRAYMVTLLLAVLTSFTVSSTGTVNAGHLFGVILYGFAVFGLVIYKKAWFGRFNAYLSTFFLSLSFCLSLVPGISETLRRLPVAQPIAENPQSPVIMHALGGLLLVFIVGYIAQAVLIYRRGQASSWR